MPVSRNDLLDEDLLGPDVLGGPVIQFKQLFWGFCTPCFCASRVEKIFFDRRLDGKRKAGVKSGEIVRISGVPRVWNRNAEFLCKLVCVVLVPYPSNCLPRGVVTRNSSGGRDESGSYISSRWEKINLSTLRGDQHRMSTALAHFSGSEPVSPDPHTLKI
jgi:hypothetical protein